MTTAATHTIQTIDIQAKDLAAEACYRLLTGLVVPRPIAWVTTVSATGTVNLAPFSHFTFVSPKPPMLAISVGQKAGVYKDTARNIMTSEEFVVHIADRPLIPAVHDSAVEHPPRSARSSCSAWRRGPASMSACPG
nr:flavin reductase [Phreatobacter stygius]